MAEPYYIRHKKLIKMGLELAKDYDVYFLADYCNKNQLNIKTLKKSKNWCRDPLNYFFINKTWRECFEPK